MASHLLITVRLHEGRYHGAGDHPISPARLFQALIAGLGFGCPNELKKAFPTLEWIEKLTPPTIAMPFMKKGSPVKSYVPNNDLDALGGNPGRVGEIRTEKSIRPWLFDSDVPVLFAWGLPAGDEEARIAREACQLSEHLYQFGRGVDMAWAFGEIVDDVALADRLRSYPGQVFRPSISGDGPRLPCPMAGSLASLIRRHAAGSSRFSTSEGRLLFTQQPKPRFAHVAYDSPPSRYVFELRMRSDSSAIGVWALTRASMLVRVLRDGAAARLQGAMPRSRVEVERYLVGRSPDETVTVPTESRIRIIPMPSIGHQHADYGIRRVFVEVPSSCPLRGDDVRWAFSGLDVIDLDTGEDFGLLLMPSTNASMLWHYCANDGVVGYRRWRTVTPAALPEAARRRRVDPDRVHEDAKSGREREAEQARAAASVHQALRHAQVTTSVGSIRVQREPLASRGDRAEKFAAGTRFDKHRLWHVEIAFDAPIRGPVVIGDGRFLGLGVLAPLTQHAGIYAFNVEEGLAAAADPLGVSRALRRAVMVRVQATLPRNTGLPMYFSGHEADGSPGRSKDHLSFAFDPRFGRMLIVAPHVCARRDPTGQEIRDLDTLEQALMGFRELRAGSAGLLRVRASTIAERDDSLIVASRTWESVTRYQVTRHIKNVGVSDALSADVSAECRRRGLPGVRVTTVDVEGIPRVGLVGHVRLDFDVAIEGPILLGRSRHLGGGLFAAARIPPP